MGDGQSGQCRRLLGLMMEEDKDILMACWTALGAVISSIPKELQPSYVRTMREAVQVHSNFLHTAAICTNLSAQELVLSVVAGDKAPGATSYVR